MATDDKKIGELDGDHGERLEALTKEWEKPLQTPGNLSASDLRLLLEHSHLVRNLIRCIAVSPEDAAQPPTATHQYGLPSDSEAQCQAAALQDLKQCTPETKKLSEANRILKDEKKELKKQLQQAQKRLDASQATTLSNAVPALAMLRADLELVQRLGLPNLPGDDTQALIHIVAVLAQRENLERLWSALKDRCEAEKRSVTSAEHELLKTALAWHNHNWRTHPYRLIEAAPSSTYHFEDHLRSRHTQAGETVVELLLPGIADSSGQPLCKALVRTR